MNTIAAYFLSAIQKFVATSSMGILQESESSDGGASTSSESGEVASDLGGQLQEHAAEVSETLNQSEAVQQISGQILEPIFQFGEFLAFPSFYWVAFALMVAGVVSFAGQLVFAKFFLLFKGSLNLREIISDAFCLIVCAIGLVLTTQTATEHSAFTDNSVAVVSSTLVGALVGVVFYWWGQRTEFEAVEGKAAKEAAKAH